MMTDRCSGSATLHQRTCLRQSVFVLCFSKEGRELRR